MQKILPHRQLIIATIALVVIAGAVFFSPGGWQGQHGAASFSIRTLLGKEEPVTCTFTSLAEVADTSGTVYIAHGMMRGDFDSTIKSAAGGKVIKSHMIVDHTHTYAWSSAMPGLGVKMALATPDEKEQERKGQGSPTPLDIDQKFDFRCTPWPENPAQFKLPPQVNFQDMNTLMNAAAKADVSVPLGTGVAGVNYGATNPLPMSADQKKAQCAACDQAGPNRDICRNALACP